MHLTIVLELYLIYFEVIFKVPMNENEMYDNFAKYVFGRKCYFIKLLNLHLINETFLP